MITDLPLAGLLDGGRQPDLPALLPLDDGSRLHCLQSLRLLPGRRWTVRGQWQEKQVLAKILVADARLPARLARERAGHDALLRAGIPTPALLDCRRSACGRFGVLLFAFLDAALPLHKVLATADGRALWLPRLAEALARLHTAGLYQADIHPDNFLCQNERLWVIDTASLRRQSGALPARTALNNLALLLAQWPLSEQADLWPLLADYRTRQALPLPDAAVRAAVQRAWRRRSHRFLNKTLRDCSQFAVRRSGQALASWERDRDGPQLQAFLADPDRLMATSRCLKDGNSATVVQATLDGRPVVIKRYNIKDRWRFLRRALRRSRARNAWLAAWLLGYAGIETPRPVCLLEHRRLGLNTRAWLVTEAVAGEPLQARHLDTHPGLMAALQRLVAALAAAGISHGDMKASNFLAAGDRLWLIDLDAMRWHRRPQAARTGLRRDVARFLRNWQQQPELHRRFSQQLESWA